MNFIDKKLIRACTVSQSCGFFVGMIPELHEQGYEVVAVTSDGPELQKVREAGAKIVTVEMERHISPLKDLKSLWKLIRVFRRERPQIVHSMTPKAGLLCMIAAKLTGVPVRVHTFTGLVFPTATGLTKRILMTTDALTCACATHVIPEGEGVKRDLLSHEITKKPIKVLGYGNCRGIDLDRFNPENREIAEAAAKIRASLSPVPTVLPSNNENETPAPTVLPSNNENETPAPTVLPSKKTPSVLPSKFTFIAIGRLVGDKGINELVDAFKRLNREIPDTRLILVGRYEPELDPLNPETTREIKTNTAIKAVGQQSDVRPWLLASDCHVLASYREGFPNVVIEAGAMGLPQIVTDINGANEIIIEGENGTIVPSKDADALYRAMRRMATDCAWRYALAANARRLIASRYEQSFVRRCLYDFYRSAITSAQ